MASIGGIDTITSVGSGNLLVSNGNVVEQISPVNFMASQTSGALYNSDANTTTVSTSGTGETDLHTFTVPAGALSSAGQYLNWNGIITATGVTAGGAMSYKLYVNGSSLGTISVPVLGNGAVNGGAFSIKLFYLTASTGLYNVSGSVKGATSNGVLDYANASSIDFTSSIALKITGTATNAGGETPVGNCRFSILTKSIT
jgi:hypothetical protein